MRQPAVADRFYPGSPQALAQAIQELMPEVATAERRSALAVAAPHAGYVYSGNLAGKTLARVLIPETVLLIGPNHRGQGSPVSLSSDTWMMPFGPVPCEEKLCHDLVNRSPAFRIDESAHRHEHSLEVQLPFLQKVQQHLRIVPLVVSHIAYSLCEELARTIAEAITAHGSKVLIVASTDMNHYESRQKTEKKDRMALRCIELFKPDDLYRTVHDEHITMCGVIPVVIAMLAAQALGGGTAELVGYTDSGHLSGDTRQVVGYAGVIFN
jgi:MEMO1 family protein